MMLWDQLEWGVAKDGILAIDLEAFGARVSQETNGWLVKVHAPGYGIWTLQEWVGDCDEAKEKAIALLRVIVEASGYGLAIKLGEK